MPWEMTWPSPKMSAVLRECLTFWQVKSLHVFSVDNPLCKPADPRFVGYGCQEPKNLRQSLATSHWCAIDACQCRFHVLPYCVTRLLGQKSWSTAGTAFQKALIVEINAHEAQVFPVVATLGIFYLSGIGIFILKWSAETLEQIYSQSVVSALLLLLIPVTSMLLFLRFGKLHPTRKLEWWQRRVVDQAW